MKISASKKQLAKIISENGGWREGANLALFGNVSERCYLLKTDEWPVYNATIKGFFVNASEVASDFPAKPFANWHQTILSRDEYFHLYPAPDADGWIEWNGGMFAPVIGSATVDVMYANGAIGFGASGDSVVWEHKKTPRDYTKVVAYRLHKPASGVETTEPAPTIEQLAAEYRNRKDYAERKQQEADERKQQEADEAMAEAEAKLAELYQAGLDIGLDIAIASDEQEQDPELVITDWRDLQVGDEIEYLGGTTRNWIGRKGVVELIGGKDEYPILFRDGEEGVSEDPSNWDSTRWCNDFKFIRRPAKEAAHA